MKFTSRGGNRRIHELEGLNLILEIINKKKKDMGAKKKNVGKVSEKRHKILILKFNREIDTAQSPWN